ncbi:MAG: hypothetical protein ACKOB3_02255 [Holophagaceae bacterium]
MLRLALRGEEIVVVHHHPQMDNDFHARSTELVEAAVLHLGRSDVPGHPVLDVPGGEKKFILEVVVVVVVGVIIDAIVARDDKVAAFLLIWHHRPQNRRG